MMASPMKWGLIGSSGLAAKACAPAIAEADGAELVAVLGTNAERARSLAAEHGASTATTDLNELLATPDLGAVWIASPTHLHLEQCTAALQAGKHVLLEKPIGMSADEGWKLVEAAKSAGLVLAVGYQARYVPGHEKMRELIAEGAIGKVSVARTHYGVHRAGPPPAWRQKRNEAHWGALADVGTHHIDLLRMLLGDVAEATGYSVNALGFETDDSDVAALRFESGTLATVTASVNVWKQYTRVEIFGTEGALIAEDTSPRGDGTVVRLRPEGAPEDITGVRRNPWITQVERVTQAARGEDVRYATGVDGTRALEVMHQIVP
jgi:1,5-anhydro-D-fructose reductase (1,5-anhydro-D-mannitol-forming)